MAIFEMPQTIGYMVPILRTLIIVAIVLFISGLILNIIKKILFKRTKTKKHRSDVYIFIKVTRFIIVVLVVVVAIFSYSGSWSSLGLTVGLFSAALGWALQKPITGIAAWMLVVTRRPFEIGDRVMIGDKRGDVIDITITHIYLSEIGGLTNSEENTGRIILVPNSILFDQNIINYTKGDDFILSEVIVTVTYESDINLAKKICEKTAKNRIKEFAGQSKIDAYTRTFFQPSGIDIHVRYFIPARRVQEFTSQITQDIFNKIRKTKNVEIAYPHTQLVIPKNYRR